MKRTFGIVEAIFDSSYLFVSLLIGCFMLVDGKLTMGIMAIILVFGDAFHLVPRMLAVFSEKEEILRRALGRGKQIASITMTVFYLFLWYIVEETGNSAIWLIMTVYLLAVIRIVLCLLPQNQWQDRHPPIRWGIWRNIPFFLLGIIVAVRFFLFREAVGELRWVWLAVLLSFLFYLPVVLWSNRKPQVGMLMFPKTCMYVWILIMCYKF